MIDFVQTDFDHEFQFSFSSKVHLSRERHSRSVVATHQAVIEQLEAHLCTFNPAEFDTDLEGSTALAQKCLNEYPPIKISIGSVITKATGQAVIDAIRAKVDGHGCKWQQLMDVLGKLI